MRIRKKLQSHLLPPDSSFLASSLLGGAPATGESLKPRADESVAATEHALDRETGGIRGGLLLVNGEDVLSPPGEECISGECSDFNSHPTPPESAIDGRYLSPCSAFPHLIEAAKREVNEDDPLKRAVGSSQSKTKQEGIRHLRERKTVKAEEREYQEDDEEDEKPNNRKKTAAMKKGRRPAVLMEGSRCSRVNGRGWRCSHQTLVGYSLCEHHLGKSRLRSVNTVKCNDRMKKEELHVSEEDSEWEEETTTMNGKRKQRRKIGNVKARSICSLLHQTQVLIVAPPPSSSSAGVSVCIQ